MYPEYTRILAANFAITFPDSSRTTTSGVLCSRPERSPADFEVTTRGFPFGYTSPVEPRPMGCISVGMDWRSSGKGERRRARLLSVRSKGTGLVGRAHRLDRGTGETRTAVTNSLHNYPPNRWRARIRERASVRYSGRRAVHEPRGNFPGEARGYRHGVTCVC
jgi:hypothetical protein